MHFLANLRSPHILVFFAYSSIGDGITYPTRCLEEDTESLLGADERSQNVEFDNETGNFLIDNRH